MTVTHDALNLTIQDTPGQGPHCTGTSLVVMSGGQGWRHVQTCSLEDPPTGAEIWWLMKHMCTVGKRVVCILLECFLVVSGNRPLTIRVVDWPLQLI